MCIGMENLCQIIQFVSLVIASFPIVSCLDISKEFSDFIFKYDRPYVNGSKEYAYRLDIFKSNLKNHQKIYQQQKYPDALFGVNKFSDLTTKEFKDLYLTDLLTPFSGLVQQTSQHTLIHNLKSLPLPAKVDWRNHQNRSYVSPVKNQKACGGCWAFATVETVESMFAKKTQTAPPVLSVQEAIDCGNAPEGCKGGDTCQALNWMVSTKTPILTDKEYPLTDTSDYCQMAPPGTKGVMVLNYTCDKFEKNEQPMLQYLHQVGPLAVSVDAKTWKDYLGGIIQYHCSNYNDHAVQIVGYDISGEVPYYIVRNSWGTDFGHDGYLYIKVGGNVCGIAQHVSTVEV